MKRSPEAILAVAAIVLVECGSRTALDEEAGAQPEDSGTDAPDALPDAGSPRPAITVGLQQACVVSDAGGMKCWGAGPRGDGTTTSGPDAVAVQGLIAPVVSASANGNFMSCAHVQNDAVQCWGAETAQAGSGDGLLGPITKSLVSTVVMPTVIAQFGNSVHSVDVSADSACVVLTSGQAQCWGGAGHLGDGNYSVPTFTPLTVIGLTAVPLHVVVDSTFGCALLQNGQIQCWSSDEYMGIGLGNPGPVPNPSEAVVGISTATGLAKATDYACALLSDATVSCWGHDPVTGSFVLSPSKVVGLAGVTQIAAGGLTLCALLGGGGVKCWGSNVVGTVGDGTTVDRANPTDVIGLEAGVTNIACGGGTCCALLADGSAKCWGLRLGFGPTFDYDTTPVSVPGLP